MKVKKSKTIHKYNNLTMTEKNTMTKKQKKLLKEVKTALILSEIRKDLKDWSETKDGKSYKLFYQLENNR